MSFKDLSNGLIPCFINCTLGTTSTASCDKLVSICPVVKKWEPYENFLFILSVSAHRLCVRREIWISSMIIFKIIRKHYEVDLSYGLQTTYWKELVNWLVESQCHFHTAVYLGFRFECFANNFLAECDTLHGKSAIYRVLHKYFNKRFLVEGCLRPISTSLCNSFIAAYISVFPSSAEPRKVEEPLRNCSPNEVWNE